MASEGSREARGQVLRPIHAEAARILVVEDDESVALTLGAILEAEGYEVSVTASVPDALAEIERKQLAAALIDLHLDGVGGLAVLPPLKNRWPHAAAIVLTGHASLDAAVKAMRAGADDFLLKPAEVEELKASLARAIHWRAQLDQRAAELERANQQLTAGVAEGKQREDRLRRSEAQLAQAQAVAHLGSWEWCAEQDVLSPSDELCRIYGLQADQFGVTRDAFLSRVRADDRDAVREVLDNAYKSGKSFELDYRILRPDESVRTLHAVGEVLANESGRPVGLLCAAQDVTELREAEKRVDVLEQVNRLKEEFIATASHDLKGPLTSIQGYTQLLLRRTRGASPDIEQVARGLAVIEAQTEAMTRLLNHLLDASRIQSGVLDLRTSPSELSESVERVLTRLNPLERARIDVELPDAPLAGEWEQPRIEQVLANLIGNALKYSPESERVGVTVERHPQEIQVTVRDRGMGIPTEEVARLFQRFHRTPQARESGLPGTGLGLYISSGVVEAHGGRIWAESAGVGQGAAFHFTLPCDTYNPTPAAKRARNEPRGGRKQPNA